MTKARLLSEKIKKEKHRFLSPSTRDFLLLMELDLYESYPDKHIDLLNRRILKGETIPHQEKMFSIFEDYTQWINKGKQHPDVELGKKLLVTIDQYHLILDYHVMESEADSETTIDLADRLLEKYNINSISFDKGFLKKAGKELLKLFIPEVIMPKKGKRTMEKTGEETRPRYKRSRNKHSAIELNVNKLENRGLNK